MIPHKAFLIGERIYLRPLEAKDCDGPYLIWFNDEIVCHGNSHHVTPYTREDLLEYVLTSNKQQESLILAIISKTDDLHIGNIALQNINSVVRSAEMSIIIGDRKYWNKGYGKEAVHLIYNHGFNTMNLSRISCGTFETNVSMLSIARKIGMQEEGRRRKAAFKRGKFLDIIEFGILKDEYNQLWSDKNDTEAKGE